MGIVFGSCGLCIVVAVDRKLGRATLGFLRIERDDGVTRMTASWR